MTDWIAAQQKAATTARWAVTMTKWLITSLQLIAGGFRTFQAKWIAARQQDLSRGCARDYNKCGNPISQGVSHEAEEIAQERRRAEKTDAQMEAAHR